MNMTNRRPVVAMFMLVLVLAALDQTILATALPAIRTELHADGRLAWVFSAYLIGSTVVIPLYGKLADAHGSRPWLLTAVTLFLLGSLACGFSTSLEQLIAARGLQGLGGGGLLTLTMLGVADLYPPLERGRIQGLLGASYGLATMFGPLAGGYLVEHLSWHWAFFINVPAALLALAVLARRFRPGAARHPHVVDWAGAALLALSLVCLLLATRREAGFDAGTSAALAAAAALLALGFVWVERRVAEPLVPLSLFTLPAFAAATLTSLLSGVALFAGVVFLPTYLQTALGLAPTDSAWHLLPLMAGITVAAVVSSRLLREKGRVRLQARAAGALIALAFGLLALLLQQRPEAPLLLSACVLPLGLGIGMLFPLVTVVSQTSVPPRLLGVATAVPIMVRSLGGAVGVSLMGAWLTHKMSGHLSAAALAAHAAPTPAQVGAAMAAALTPAYVVVALLGLAATFTATWLPSRLLRVQPAAVPGHGPAPGPVSGPAPISSSNAA